MCPSEDWDLENATFEIVKDKEGWTWAQCTYRRRASSESLKQIRADDQLHYYTGFQRFPSEFVEKAIPQEEGFEKHYDVVPDAYGFT